MIPMNHIALDKIYLHVSVDKSTMLPAIDLLSADQLSVGGVSHCPAPSQDQETRAVRTSKIVSRY